MKLKQIAFSQGTTSQGESKLEQAILKLNKLISAANQYDLPEDLVSEFNEKIDANGFSNLSEKERVKSIEKLTLILQESLRSKLGLVTKDYYRNLWMGVGMAAFGIPFGVVFSTILKNYAFIGIGLPIGLAIGVAIGTSKDNQAKAEGKQLDV